MSQNTPETIVIRAEPIELSQLLKFAGIFGSGGEAKFAINGGEVTVNGVVELQARKKILGGQTVVIGDRTLLVKLGAGGAVKAKTKPKPMAKAKPANAAAPTRPVRPADAAKPAFAAKSSFGGAKPVAKPAVAAPKSVRRDRDDDGYEDESPREKPAASAASQRTFFYTELLKKQQGNRKKR